MASRPPPSQRRLSHLRQQLSKELAAGVASAGPGGEHDWSVPLVDSKGHHSKAEDDLKFFRENYAKQEAMVSMRDGVRLFTVVYVPFSGSEAAAGFSAHPILLQRTPYSCAPYGVDEWAAPRGPMKTYAREGFIFVQQDVRGRNGSEGDFRHMRPHRRGKHFGRATAEDALAVDESTDTFDTIAWLVSTVPRNNGRVGLLGISYPGFYAAVCTEQGLLALLQQIIITPNHTIVLPCSDSDCCWCHVFTVAVHRSMSRRCRQE